MPQCRMCSPCLRDILVFAYFPRFNALTFSCIFWAALWSVRVAFPTPRRQHDLNLRPMQMPARRAPSTYFAYHVGERLKGRWWSAPTFARTHRARCSGFCCARRALMWERDVCAAVSKFQLPSWARNYSLAKVGSQSHSQRLPLSLSRLLFPRHSQDRLRN